MKKTLIMFVVVMALVCNPSIQAAEMIFILGGEFLMGDHLNDQYGGWQDEVPVHAVALDSFFIGQAEITNQEYCEFLNSAYLDQIKVVNGLIYSVSDAGNQYPYCKVHPTDQESQITFNEDVFTVRTKSGRDMSNDPVVEMQWYGAAAYCNWLSSEEGKDLCYDISMWTCDFNSDGYRLPTEAEWEYAARGGEYDPYYRFPWGDTISFDEANYRSNVAFPYDLNSLDGYHPDWYDGVEPYTSPVDAFPANGYGLYDMGGNVNEWINDWYSSSYYQECKDLYGYQPCPNPTGPSTGTTRVFRSGAHNHYAAYSRVAFRSSTTSTNGTHNFGFRIARNASPIEEIGGFIEDSIENGGLVPVKEGKAGEVQVNVLIDMILSASNKIKDGNIASACAKLKVALGKTDGLEPQPDFVTGPAAPELAAMIEALIADLDCE